MRKLFVVLPLLVLFCTNVPQKVKLDPVLQVPADTIGKGSFVFVDVVDRRQDSVLGYRGVDSIHISTPQDLAFLVKERIAEGLQTRSFRIATDSAQGAVLILSLEKIQYAVKGRFLHSDIGTESSVRVTARRGNTQFTRHYKFEDQGGTLLLPSEKTNQRRVNALVSEVLNRILNDERLIGFLAGTGT